MMNQSPRKFILLENLDSANHMQRLTYEKYGDGEPQSLFITKIHGNEGKVGDLLPEVIEEVLREDENALGNHLRIDNANPEAVAAGTREVRGVDLNRAFRVGDVLHDRARLLEQVLLTNPTLKNIFSFHEDPEGVRRTVKVKTDDGRTVKLPYLDQWGKENPLPIDLYFYHAMPEATVNQDSLPGDGIDAKEARIQVLRHNMIKALKEANFNVFTGIDDPSDCNLGMLAEDGYIRQPADTNPDYSFEWYALKLKEMGKTETDSSFTFDIPTDLDDDRKKAMLKIIFTSFIIPLIAADNRI